MSYPIAWGSPGHRSAGFMVSTSPGSTTIDDCPLSRRPYARINAYFHSYGNDDNGVIVAFHTWANPYGERNLEAEPRLRYDTQQRLHDEAQAALLAGKLPPKPDIPKLLKTEGEYKE